MITRTRLAFVLVALAMAALPEHPSALQYGHPLKGTWSGDWGPSAETRHRVLLELHWDGKTITGTINPGPNAVALRSAALDPSSWTVTLEAERRESSGAVVRYRIEGKLENLGAYRRVLSGTWIQGDQRGDFRLTRN